MAKKSGLILMLLGALFIISALALLIYNRLEANSSGDAARDALEQLQTELGDNAEVTALPLPDELATIEIDGNKYIGYISIPQLELELPVLENWSSPGLRLAPCRYFGSIATGMVIAAHNYDSHFGRINLLRPGDEVYFIDVGGRAYKYEVAEVETLEPTAIVEMVSDEWDLTLFTCTYGGQSRVTVRCVLTN